MSDQATLDTTNMSDEQILAEIRQRIETHPVMLFMKGTPDFPMCGFSGRTAEVLRSLGAPFGALNVLTDPRIRQVLSSHSDWPTIPQLFVGGEFVGGCDIVVEMHQSGQLESMVREAVSDGGSPAD
jgi:monothiol glutaredoxin